MLKKRILASSLASVMALSSVSVMAFAEDETDYEAIETVTLANLKDTAEGYVKQKFEATDLASFRERGIYEFGGTRSAELRDAIDYITVIDTHKNDYRATDATAAYQMLKAVGSKAQIKYLEDLKNLMDDCAYEYNTNNKLNSKSDDYMFEVDGYNNFAAAYNTADGLVKSNATDTMAITDAWDALDEAYKALVPKKTVRKADFDLAIKALEDAIEPTKYDSWRRGTIDIEDTDNLYVGDLAKGYNNKMVAWGTFTYHISCVIPKVIDINKMFEDKKGADITTDDTIVAGYKKTCDALVIAQSFKPDPTNSAIRNDISILLKKYHNRLAAEYEALQIVALLNFMADRNGGTATTIPNSDGNGAGSIFSNTTGGLQLTNPTKTLAGEVPSEKLSQTTAGTQITGAGKQDGSNKVSKSDYIAYLTVNGGKVDKGWSTDGTTDTETSNFNWDGAAKMESASLDVKLVNADKTEKWYVAVDGDGYIYNDGATFAVVMGTANRDLVDITKPYSATSIVGAITGSSGGDYAVKPKLTIKEFKVDESVDLLSLIRVSASNINANTASARGGDWSSGSKGGTVDTTNLKNGVIDQDRYGHVTGNTDYFAKANSDGWLGAYLNSADTWVVDASSLLTNDTYYTGKMSGKNTGLAWNDNIKELTVSTNGSLSGLTGKNRKNYPTMAIAMNMAETYLNRDYTVTNAVSDGLKDTTKTATNTALINEAKGKKYLANWLTSNIDTSGTLSSYKMDTQTAVVGEAAVPEYVRYNIADTASVSTIINRYLKYALEDRYAEPTSETLKTRKNVEDLIVDAKELTALCAKAPIFSAEVAKVNAARAKAEEWDKVSYSNRLYKDNANTGTEPLGLRAHDMYEQLFNAYTDLNNLYKKWKYAYEDISGTIDDVATRLEEGDIKDSPALRTALIECSFYLSKVKPDSEYGMENAGFDDARSYGHVNRVHTSDNADDPSHKLLTTAYENLIAAVKEADAAGQAVLGDVDGSGKVDLKDALMIVKAVAAGTADELKNGDFDGSGTTDLKDALAIVKAVAAGTV